MHFGAATSGGTVTGRPTTDLPIFVTLLGLPTGKGPTSTFERAPSPLNLGIAEEPL